MLCVSFTFSLWLDGVLPLVMDRETTAQEKCFQILEDVLISNVVPQSKLVKGMFFWCEFQCNVLNHSPLDLACRTGSIFSHFSGEQ